MKRLTKILPLLLVASLNACSQVTYQTDFSFYFDANFEISIYAKGNKAVKEIKRICQLIDNMADSHQKRDTFNVYDLNQTNEDVEVSYEFYSLLECAQLTSEKTDNFNILIGSLSNKWKEALANKEVLSDTAIQEELNKINNSSLSLSYRDDKYYAQRIGEAEIDLGGVAKGYALDKIYEYLINQNIDRYLINAGSSSVLLGSNYAKTWKGRPTDTFVVSLRDVPNTYIKAHHCVLSSSGNDIQGVEIDGVTYSHIVNPLTGKVVMENDAVIVMTPQGEGALGDVLSTSLMMKNIDEIKAIEEKDNIRTIVVKDGKIAYSHPSIKM